MGKEKHQKIQNTAAIVFCGKLSMEQCGTGWYVGKVTL